MNSLIRFNLCGLWMVFALAGCSKEEASSPAQNSQGIGDEEALVCQSGLSIGDCISTLSASQLKKLEATLGSYGSNGRWPGELMNTHSFETRYPLNDTEKKCLQDKLCKKVDL